MKQNRYNVQCTILVHSCSWFKGSIAYIYQSSQRFEVSEVDVVKEGSWNWFIYNIKIMGQFEKKAILENHDLTQLLNYFYVCKYFELLVLRWILWFFSDGGCQNTMHGWITTALIINDTIFWIGKRPERGNLAIYLALGLFSKCITLVFVFRCVHVYFVLFYFVVFVFLLNCIFAVFFFVFVFMFVLCLCAGG